MRKYERKLLYLLSRRMPKYDWEPLQKSKNMSKVHGAVFCHEQFDERYMGISENRSAAIIGHVQAMYSMRYRRFGLSTLFLMYSTTRWSVTFCLPQLLPKCLNTSRNKSRDIKLRYLQHGKCELTTYTIALSISITKLYHVALLRQLLHIHVTKVDRCQFCHYFGIFEELH